MVRAILGSLRGLSKQADVGVPGSPGDRRAIGDPPIYEFGMGGSLMGGRSLDSSGYFPSSRAEPHSCRWSSAWLGCGDRSRRGRTDASVRPRRRAFG
jgi:hypothetical protein